QSIAVLIYFLLQAGAGILVSFYSLEQGYDILFIQFGKAPALHYQVVIHILLQVIMENEFFIGVGPTYDLPKAKIVEDYGVLPFFRSIVTLRKTYQMLQRFLVVYMCQ